MRKASASLLAAALVSACQPVPSRRSVDRAPFSSVVKTGDARAAYQLLRGFHQIEEGSWRWTAGQFSAALRVPDHAASGLRLRIDLWVAPDSIARFGRLRMRCLIGDHALDPIGFAASGAQVYLGDLPSRASGEAGIDCVVSPVLAPSPQDSRERGVVVRELALLPLDPS